MNILTIFEWSLCNRNDRVTLTFFILKNIWVFFMDDHTFNTIVSEMKEKQLMKHSFCRWHCRAIIWTLNPHPNDP